MVKLKAGVDLRGVRPEMLFALIVAKDIYSTYGLDCVVTSVVRPPEPKSLHDDGLAIDLRSKVVPRAHLDPILAALKESLPGFDVILEDRGGENEHFHLEHDPKGLAPSHLT